MDAINILRRPSLYFPDGDIAITAQGSKGRTYMYRVDIMFLSRHSPVFHKMLAKPNESPTAMLDGVPVVHLSDHADDVTAILEALYDPS